MNYNFDQILERRQTNSIKWNLFDPDVLPMWVADMDFLTPAPILQSLQKAVEHGVFGYDYADQSLAKAVVQRMKQLYNWEIDEKSVVLTTGLVSAFYAAASALCDAGEGYLIQPPVYMPFNDLQEDLGIIRQESPLVRIENGSRISYKIDWDDFENAFHSSNAKTKMFLLCNPHNPTGQAYTRAELEKMAEICLKNDVVIVSDEIHSELLLDGNIHTPIASLSKEIADRSMTLVSPSKTFNIAGLFCGFAIIPNAELRQQFQRETKRMTLHVNGLGLVAAQAAFSGECEDWLKNLKGYLTRNRDFLLDFAQKNLPGIKVTSPQATYLAWLDCNDLVKSGKIKGNPQEFFLNKARVALNDGKAFGVGGENFVRLNFGCPLSVLEEGLKRMQKALEDE